MKINLLQTNGRELLPIPGMDGRPPRFASHLSSAQIFSRGFHQFFLAAWAAAPKPRAGRLAAVRRGSGMPAAGVSSGRDSR